MPGKVGRPRKQPPHPAFVDRRQPWQIAQAAKCPCRGADDMCVCQNVDQADPAQRRPSREDLEQRIRELEGTVRTLEMQQETDRQTITALNRRADTASGGRGEVSQGSPSAHASPLRSAAATEAQHSAGWERMMRNAVYAWVREDLDVGAKLLIGWQLPKLMDRLFALSIPHRSREDVAEIITDACMSYVPAGVQDELEHWTAVGVYAADRIGLHLSSEAQSPQSEAKPSAGNLPPDDPPSSPPPNPVGDEAVTLAMARAFVEAQYGAGCGGSACTDLLGAGPDGPGASDRACQTTGEA